MIALSVVAAGVIAIAAVLFVRPSLEGTPPRAADQRGITLQTLIVTAVLVLMAVAAGVVIVAITNSARDDLQGQTPNTDAEHHILPVDGDRSVDLDGNGSGSASLDVGQIDGDTGSAIENLEIRVATNQRYCQVWNTTTDEEEFRSES